MGSGDISTLVMRFYTSTYVGGVPNVPSPCRFALEDVDEVHVMSVAGPVKSLRLHGARKVAREGHI